MGASNFGDVNTDTYYIITEKDVEEYGLEGIAEEFKYLFNDRGVSFTTDVDTRRELKLGYIEANNPFYLMDIDIAYKIYLQPGYYEDYALDFDYIVSINGSSITLYNDIRSIEDIINYLDEYHTDYEINNGLWKMHRNKLKKILKEEDTKIRQSIEEVFNTYTLELERMRIGEIEEKLTSSKNIKIDISKKSFNDNDLDNR